MRDIIGTRVIKTAIGATLALFIADQLQLQFASAAAIVTILSIQETKKKSVKVAIKRFAASLIALVIGGVLFTVLGHYASVFGLFLLLFIPMTVALKVQEGIVSASVLVTHLLGSGGITIGLLINEVLLVIIGISVALAFNLYMPSREKELDRLRGTVEETMYELFKSMSEGLQVQTVSIREQAYYETIRTSILKGKQKAYSHNDNHLFGDQSLYEKYFEMREDQYRVLEMMRRHFSRFFMTFQETKQVAAFTRLVAESIKGQLYTAALIEELEILRRQFRTSPLPKTREEFENRAMLYQFLNDMEQFLLIKKAFTESLSPEALEMYQKGVYYL